MTVKQGAILASLYAGVMFGVFWVPIRALENAGFAGPWPATVYLCAPVVFILPLYWRQRDELRLANARGLLGGILCGVALALYALAFLYTDVVRAVLLFYLMPMWGFVLGRVFLGDAITPARWLAVVLGFAGIGIIFGFENGLPVPENRGDWMALASGVCWAVASLLMLMDRKVSPWLHGANFFLVAAILTLGLALTSQAPMPDFAMMRGVVWWLLPVTVLIALPVGFATIYGPTQLNPGVVGLLFMGEVAVAALSASILTDEVFGTREAAGVVLIMAAGLLEPVREIVASRRSVAQ